jgi:hypothetical protein
MIKAGLWLRWVGANSLAELVGLAGNAPINPETQTG